MVNTINHARLSDQKVLALLVGLYESVAKSNSPHLAANLLAILLTPQELRTTAIRLRIIQMLEAGYQYKSIQRELHVSSGTVARIRLALEHGSASRSLRGGATPDIDIEQSRVNRNRTYGRSGQRHGKYAEWLWPAEVITSIVKGISQAKKK